MSTLELDTQEQVCLLELDTQERVCLKLARNWLYASLFCAFFGAAYEVFSHEVYSYFMLYAFVLPLALGALPSILYGLRGTLPPSISARLWGAGTAALTTGFLFQGVLDIYGTSSALALVYWIVGGLLLLSAIGLHLLSVILTGAWKSGASYSQPASEMK